LPFGWPHLFFDEPTCAVFLPRINTEVMAGNDRAKKRQINYVVLDIPK
jgi:hypothetical protein